MNRRTRRSEVDRRRADRPRARAAPPATLARRPRLLAGASVVLLSIACYANSLRGALLYDDIPDIVHNDFVRDFDVARIFTSPSWAAWVGIGYAGYRPVATLTFALDYAVHGVSPLGYHLVNVALHAAVSLLVAAVFARVSREPALAAVTALLFAAHPVHTEAVASVVGRAELLAGALALAAWWLVLEGRSRARRRGLWYGAAGVALAAGILAKESAIAIVPAMVAADLVTRPTESDAPRLRSIDFPAYAVLAGATTAALLLRTAVLHGVVGEITRLDNPLVGTPLGARALTTLAVIARYAQTLVWPFALSADYSYKQIDAVTSLLDARAVVGLGILVVALVAVVRSARRARPVYLGTTFFLATVGVPLAATFAAVGPTMAERLLYVPAAGFCLLVAAALERLPAARVRHALLAIVLAAYAGGTYARNRVWRDPRTFFETMVTTAPMSARSHSELGGVLSELHEYDRAITEFETSLRILRMPATLYDLGNAHLRAGRIPEAKAAYEEALALRPGFVEAMINMGNADSARGDEDEAEAWFRRAIAANPSAADARLNLANSLLRRGRLAEAEGHYRQAVTIAPRGGLARFNYGACLDALGRSEEAAAQYRKAVDVAPDLAAAYVRLATILHRLGRRDEAATIAASAERRFPADPSVKRLLEVLAAAP